MPPIASLPAMLLALNLSGAPDEEPPRGSAAGTIPESATDVGYARVRINRDIRFVTSNEDARETIESLQAASPPAEASGLPRRLEFPRSFYLGAVCNPVCARR